MSPHSLLSVGSDAIDPFTSQAESFSTSSQADLSSQHSPKVTSIPETELLSQPINSYVEPIAIIGLACNFPGGSSSPEKFWDLIVNGRNALSGVPKSRWNTEGFYRESNAKIGLDPGLFDAPFFKITAAEALCTDPQQRWLLEKSYHAFENAGIPLEDIPGSRTAVFVGSFLQDYAYNMGRDQDLPASHQTTGSSNAILANRLSWFFNLKGPSMAVDTACSGSLISLHLACQSIRLGESDMALVGGCNLMLNPDTTTHLSNNGFLSPDGISYTFDHRANGYARGEGVGMVLVKRLSHAIRDGNIIRAVIRATGSNQDGRTPGITHPDTQAQKELIQETYRAGSLSMAETRYFEAHGTGTPIGDPIEARAIAEAFSDHLSDKNRMIVGSLKPNIGHLENVSGIASVIKTVLSLEKGVIPPCGRFEKLNPSIERENLNLAFPTSATAWPSKGLRRASINSFGFGGSNCHVILDDARSYLQSQGINGHHITTRDGPSIETKKPPILDEPRLLVFSAFDEEGSRRISSAYKEYAEATKTPLSPQLLADLAFTLSERRSKFPCRTFLIASSSQQISAEKFEKLPKTHRHTKAFKALFVFTGQGAQWPEMGRELLQYPVFRKSLESSEMILKRLGCKWSLLQELAKTSETTNINKPDYSQPVCTAIQLALVDLLRQWRVQPEAVVGHSSGEIAAAYCIRAVSRESALKLAYYRGIVSSLARRLSSGSAGMMAVGVSSEKVQRFIDLRFGSCEKAGVYIACINSQNNVTLSGNVDGLNALEADFVAEGIFARIVKTGVPYHSPYMEDVAAVYEAMIHGLKADEKPNSNVSMFSSTTIKQVTTETLLSPQYWVQNLTSPVHFLEAFSQMFQDRKKSNTRKLGAAKTKPATAKITFVLEVGPHPALKGPVHEILRNGRYDDKILYSPTLQRKQSATEALLQAAGQLYASGADIDLIAANNLNDAQSSLKLLTNLPSYPFNHSRKYWNESRTSREYRSRSNVCHDLLGTLDLMSSPLEPRWRHYISSDEFPWTRDHNISGVDLYPAAGFLVMAIEAAKQVADEHKVLASIRFQNVVFGSALIVPPTAPGVESQLSLKLVKAASGAAPAWYGFRLCSYSGQSWSECCTGEIGLEYEQQVHEVEGKDPSTALFEHLSEIHETAKGRVSGKMSTSDLYSTFEKAGLKYGPSFQALEDVQYTDDREALARLNVSSWTEWLEGSHTMPHTIHPSTLDNIFQLTLPAASQGGPDRLLAMVPTRIPSLRIFTKPVSTFEDPVLDVYASTKGLGARTAIIELSAIHSKEQAVLIDGTLEISAIESQNESAEPLGICYGFEWKPDFDLMTIPELTRYCEPDSYSLNDDTSNRDVRKLLDVRLQALYHAADTLSRPTVYTERSAHIWHFADFLRRQLSRIDDSFVPCENLNQYLDEMSPIVCNRAEGEGVVRVARNLNAILDGSADYLEILFCDDMMARVYEEGCFEVPQKATLNTLIDTIAHKNPTLRILEIGAGTGSATIPIMHSLSRNGDSHEGGSRFSSYVYTDISVSFFEAAKERFAQHCSQMEFRTLDIEKDPKAQGFEDSDFDIIVACNVLHATSDLNSTLKNVNRLLKPGGKLLLTELTVPDNLWTTFVYGLLPGWWLSTDDDRTKGPLLDEKQWNTALEKNSFTGLDIAIRNNEVEDLHVNSFMVSTKPQAAPAYDPGTRLLIVTSAQSPLQQALVTKIESFASQLGIENCERADVNDISWPDCKDVLCVFLPELNADWLPSISQQEFTKLKTLLSSTRGMLWLFGADGSLRDASSGLAVGLSRAYRTEHIAYRFVTLTVNIQKEVNLISNDICKVLSRTLLSGDGSHEDDYREIDGLLHIQRAVQSKQLDKQVLRQSLLRAEMQPFRVPNGMKTMLRNASPGLLETLQFVENSELQKALQDTHIEVEVRATGLNFKDVLIANGQVDQNSFGLECAGVVTKKGGRVDNFEVGDRVLCLTPDCFANTTRCIAAYAARIPDDMSFTVAASFPSVAATAVHALIQKARLAPGESILIHSGAGGLGQLAIQVAKYCQATIYTTVGSKEKAEFLHERYDIPKEHIMSSRTLSFAPKIERLTQGRGVDVVLNSLSGDALRDSWKCVAPFGRFIEVGLRDATERNKLPMEMFAHNITFTGIELSALFREKQVVAANLLKETMDLVIKGHISNPYPINVFPGTELVKAFRLLQSGKSTGKVVVEFNGEDLVSTLPSQSITWSFDPNASYLVAGGLGGLGRSVAQWMASRGARNLILLSRRKEHGPEVKEFLDQLDNQGVKVATPACDIANETCLKMALEGCKELPPIKGCIQASMVLKDEAFDQMSLENYHEPLKPKFNGSLNLHNLLPKDMDFFIWFSSIAGTTGWPGQTSYAMGNVFQDHLAWQRASEGQKAVSLDFGIIYDAGWVAANSSLKDSMRKIGFLGIEVKQLLAVLEHYCDPNLPLQLPYQSQVSVGAENLAQTRARGGDEGPWFKRRLYSVMNQISLLDEQGKAGGSGGNSRIDLMAALKATKTVEEAGVAITDAMITKMALMLGMEKEGIDTDKPLHSYGIDSLVAIEVRNWLRKTISSDVAVFEILSNMSISELAVTAASKSTLVAALQKEHHVKAGGDGGAD